MNAPQKPPRPFPAQKFDPEAQQALIFARVMDLLDAIEDACHAVTVMGQCALSELVINSHADGFKVDSGGMICDANGAEVAPRLFPDADSSAETNPGDGT